MAVEAKEILKNYIDELSDAEAQKLLCQLKPSEDELVEFEQIKEKYEDIESRFDKAFRELAC